MALERQGIEKKDFPIGRRGYDPDAVDAHLNALADEFEELKRSSRRRTDTLASSASEQVRAIVEAAENSAAEIQRQAEEDAQEIRAEASSEAKSTRQQATAEAREYVGKVSESTSTMLQRLDAMESELGALFESLRTGSNRLNADLQLLEGDLTEARGSVAPRPQFELEPASEPEPSVISEPEPADDFAPEAAEELGQESSLPSEPASYDEPLVGADAPGEASSNEAPLTEHAPEGADEGEGARLIALNMALNGTPREETDKYLAENFELADRPGLLDEVYASVDG